MRLLLTEMDVSATCVVVINQVNNQRLILSTDLTKLTLNMKLATTQVVKTSVTVNNSPVQDYDHLDVDVHLLINICNYL